MHQYGADTGFAEVVILDLVSEQSERRVSRIHAVTGEVVGTEHGLA